MLLGTLTGRQDKLAYEVFPTSRIESDAVADALITERLRRLQDETGLSNEPGFAQQIVPSNNRQELLGLTYRSKLSGLSPEQRRAKRLSFLAEDIARERMLYTELSGRVDSKATDSSRVVWGVAGALAGFVMGLVALFVMERASRESVMTDKALRKQLFLYLGIVPEVQSLSMWPSIWRQAEGHENISELYRSIASKLLIADWGKNRRSYIVVSPHKKDGRTTLVGNLGIAFGKLGLRVALLDSHLENPGLREFFGFTTGRDLREIVRDDKSSHHAIATVTVATVFENVSLIEAEDPRGDTNALKWSERFDTLIHRLRDEFDLILVDSEPTQDNDLTFELSRSCDGAILVFPNRTAKADVAEIKRLLARTGDRLSGVVRNN